MMPNHPWVIGSLRSPAAVVLRVGMSGMMMSVRIGRSPVFAQISMRIVRDRIAPAAADHPRLVRTLFIDAVSLPQTGIDAKIGRRHGAPAQIATDRARGRIFGLAHAVPVAELAMSPAFVIVERHTASPDLW